MTWQPSKAELEPIADAIAAHMPVDRIAAALNVPASEFIAWRTCCMRAVDSWLVQILQLRPLPPRSAPAPKMTAERLFEGGQVEAVDVDVRRRDASQNGTRANWKLPPRGNNQKTCLWPYRVPFRGFWDQAEIGRCRNEFVAIWRQT